jgi:PPOX class probable F420-dependent enzyme
MAQLEGRARELIEEPNFCYVATLRADGSPHVAITWIDLDGDEVLLNSAEGRDWPANLRRTSRATLTIADRDNQYEYATIEARLVGDTHDGADESADRLAKKYLDQDTYPFRQEGEQRVLFRLAPERSRVYGG